MSFDIEGTLKDMLEAASAVVSGKWPEVESAFNEVMEDEKEALADIAEAFVKGAINAEDLESQLESEKRAMENGLLMIQVIAKKTVEDAVNAAIGVFEAAVKAAI